MIVQDIIKIKVPILAPELNNEIENTIKTKVKNILKKEIDNVGIIIGINDKLIEIGTGNIQLNGIVKYDVTVPVNIYKPTVGERVSTIVKNVGLNGFYAFDGYVEIFVETNSKEEKVEEGQNIELEINLVRFHKEKYLILGKRIKKNKKNHHNK